MDTADYDWVNEGTKISEESQKWLIEHYPTLESIQDASQSDLKKGPGIGPLGSAKIKKFANEALKESKDEDSPDAIIDAPLLDHVPSKRELERLAVEEEEVEEDDAEYVLVEMPVDKSFTKRTRIRIGPSTCRECGYDVINVNKLPEWEELGSIDRSKVRRTLEAHKERYHSNPSGKRVISGKEMGETSWTKPEILK